MILICNCNCMWWLFRVLFQKEIELFVFHDIWLNTLNNFVLLLFVYSFSTGRHQLLGLRGVVQLEKRCVHLIILILLLQRNRFILVQTKRLDLLGLGLFAQHRLLHTNALYRLLHWWQVWWLQIKRLLVDTRRCPYLSVNRHWSLNSLICLWTVSTWRHIDFST